MKLRTHLALLVAATALPVLILAVAVVILVQRDRQASVESGLQETARAVAVAVERELDSSITAPDDRRRSADAGFDVHLVKPVEPEQLAEVMGRELGEVRP